VISQLLSAPHFAPGLVDQALRVTFKHHQNLLLPRRSTMYQVMHEELARARVQERLSVGRQRNTRRSSLRIALEARIRRTQHQQP
jgi:hypothetical protein